MITVIIMGAVTSDPDVGNGTTFQQVQMSAAVLPLLSQMGDGRYSPMGLTASWLYERSKHTRPGYFRDVNVWLQWCIAHSVSVLDARSSDVGQFRVELGGELSPASVARRMAACSSWYGYLIHNGAPGFERNPFAGAKRPVINYDESTTVGLSEDEVLALLDAADQLRGRSRGWRSRALTYLLATAGPRLGEALSLDVADFASKAGYRTITYTAKGGRVHTRSLDGMAVAAIEDYLADRLARGVSCAGGDPLFATEPAAGGVGRLDQADAFRTVRQLARAAGIPTWEQISPHSLRHFFATYSLGPGGKTLADVQDSMGHADPRTTRRYDRDRHNLANDAALVVGQKLAARRG